MRPFSEIYTMAADRHGGALALEKLLATPKPLSTLTGIADDRWLSEMTRRVFQAGFNWTVVDNKWPDFEAAFEGFDPHRWSLMSDDDVDRLMSDKRIIRHQKKIQSVGVNAQLICALAAEHGSAAKAFAKWPAGDYIGLLDLLAKRGSRLGGTTAQYFLRGIGIDSFVISRDVARALVREGVVDKAPSTKGALKKTQDAFNVWMRESGRPLTQISQVLARSVGDS